MQGLIDQTFPSTRLAATNDGQPLGAGWRITRQILTDSRQGQLLSAMADGKEHAILQWNGDMSVCLPLPTRAEAQDARDKETAPTSSKAGETETKPREETQPLANVSDFTARFASLLDTHFKEAGIRKTNT